MLIFNPSTTVDDRAFFELSRLLLRTKPGKAQYNRLFAQRFLAHNECSTPCSAQPTTSRARRPITWEYGPREPSDKVQGHFPAKPFRHREVDRWLPDPRSRC